MKKLFTLLILLTSVEVWAQSSNVELKSWVGLGQDANPFWLTSNNYGLIQNEGTSVSQFVSGYNYIKSDKFDYETKASALFNYGLDTELFVHELYFKVKTEKLSLTIGKQEFRDGQIQNPVAIGSMLWSSNAPTMPMVMGSIDEWINVPATTGFLKFKGYLAHGWFEEDRFVENAYLHMKALSVNLGKSNWPVQIRGSIVHNVQWGGVHPTFGQLPNTFSDFTNVFFGRKGSASSNDPDPISFQGNSVGMTDYGILFPMKNSELLIAKQFFIESRMGVRYRSPADGLWALEWKNKRSNEPALSYFVYEFVNTIKQDSRRSEGEIRGGDQYYFNSLYRDGWTFENRIIGLPFIGIQNITDRNIEFFNNIILAHHVGLTSNLHKLIGTKKKLLLNLRASYSRNYGYTTSCVGNGGFCDPDNQPRRTGRNDQWYTAADLKIRYNAIATTFISLGLDQGDLRNSIGAIVGVQYNLR